MLFSDLLSNVRRIIEDEGLRWSDKAIARYAVRGVNHIYRKTGSVTDTEDYTMLAGFDTYVLTGISGKIIEVEIIPVSGPEIVLQRVELNEIPTVQVGEADPQYYALKQSNVSGDLQNKYDMVLFPTPDRNAAGAIIVTYEKEWAFTSDDVATAGQLATEVPVLARHDLDLIEYVAGSLLVEMNDEDFVKKGQYYLDKVEKELTEDLKLKPFRKHTGIRTGTYITFSEFLSDVRRVVENVSSEIDPVVVQDYGRRWDDRVIARYAVKGVNHIYRKTGSVSDSVALNMVQSQQIYTMSTPGRIIKVEILPENNNPAYTLQQVQLAEIPTVNTTEADPTVFALTQTVNSVLKATQDFVVHPIPARTANGAIVVTYSMEWVFSADPTATSSQLASEIPVLPKFEIDLVNYVAGSLMLEMGSPAFIQKGQFLLGKSEQEIGNLSYVNSLSFWANQPIRNFP